MTIIELLGILSIYTVIHGFILKWMKARQDSQSDAIADLVKDIDGAHEQIRKDHNALSLLIAKDYMNSDKTMEMYSLMSQATEQKVDAVFKKVDKMSDQLDKILLLMAGKKDKGETF